MRKAIILGAALAGLWQAALAQPVVDHFSSMKSLSALKFPAQPIEGEAGGEAYLAIHKPAGAGPFPAVVLHHTCAGIRDHISHWTNTLLKAGYVVLVNDSLGPRGIRSNCAVPLAVPTANGVQDALHALESLAGQPYVDAARIGFLGFSWGGMIALLAADKSFTDRVPATRKDLRFAAVAAAYPHCRIPAGTIRRLGEIRYLGEQVDSPLLVLMGEEDVETPVKYCLPTLEALKQKGMKVEWEVYPGAGHGFDQPQASGRQGHSLYTGVYSDS